ncbi:hypothetical protein O181_045538 [Austropuccinia psidii MF-1]|uniref:Integrase catalytic domain-containing protein n=1 Tax=Austropuccinia psidii MF-1 TaxID=1389203 RepID=A0A9Q3HHP6_9BASI|nr:hypothetical protein [Austropuccinia psidii MF-1]
MENVHERQIKKLETDVAGEFVNHQFKELSNKSGFIHVIAPPYTPEHSGVAERVNRTILNKDFCLLLTSNLPNHYWSEAINTPTYLTNIIPIPSKRNLSPFQLWTRNPWKIKKIHTFGCKVVFLIPKHKRTRKLDHVGKIGILLGLNNDSSYKILKQEMNRSIVEEVKIKDHHRLIETTWVFKTKRNNNNQIIDHKERLCSHAFSQTQGGDYSKGFAPTGKLNALRTLISVAAASGLNSEKLDIKREFLNEPIEDDVYLMVPQGLDRDKRNVFLKRKKAIYGLKQALLARYHQLSTWLMKLGFKISKEDSCVFYLKEPGPSWRFLHVDDIEIFGKNLTHFKKSIEKKFQTKMLGIADLILGIKIIHQPESITLTQSHYIDSLLDSYGMSNCKPMATPLITNCHLEHATESEKKVLQSLNINY